MKTGLDLDQVGDVHYVELRALTGYLRGEHVEYAVGVVDTEETAEAFLGELHRKVDEVAVEMGVRDALRLRLHRDASVEGWVVGFEVEVESMGRKEVAMLEAVLERVRTFGYPDYWVEMYFKKTEATFPTDP